MIFMTIVTVYALFGDDIRVLATDKVFSIIIRMVMKYFGLLPQFVWVSFLLKLYLPLFVKYKNFYNKYKDGYFVGFFFWLDLLSTVSMLLDIGWVSNAIFGTSGGAALSAVSLARL